MGVGLSRDQYLTERIGLFERFGYQEDVKNPLGNNNNDILAGMVRGKFSF